MPLPAPLPQGRENGARLGKRLLSVRRSASWTLPNTPPWSSTTRGCSMPWREPETATEGARRGDHWFHTRVRRSKFNEVARRNAETLARWIPELTKEAADNGVTEQELRRFIVVLRSAVAVADC